jgi:hypothetical protein
MNRGALQQRTTWAEDRALQRCNPSAVPGVGVKTGPDQVSRDQVRPGRFTTSHQHQSAKPVWQDAGLPTAGCVPLFANADRSEFQFTLNQDTRPHLPRRSPPTRRLIRQLQNTRFDNSSHRSACTTKYSPARYGTAVSPGQRARHRLRGRVDRHARIRSRDRRGRPLARAGATALGASLRCGAPARPRPEPFNYGWQKPPSVQRFVTLRSPRLNLAGAVPIGSRSLEGSCYFSAGSAEEGWPRTVML